MNHAQNSLYWRAWSAAKRALMPGRATWTKLEENTRRHEVTIDALGRDKSHLDFTNTDFDKVLGALRAISRPGDLSAQLRQVRGEHRRMEWQLDRLMRQLGVGRNYVQGIIDQMWPSHISPSSSSSKDPWQRDRETSARPRRLLDALTAPELKKVLIALRKQKGRARRND